MSALFDFSSLLVVILLFICATTFTRSLYPTIFNDKAEQPPGSTPAGKHEGLTGMLLYVCVCVYWCVCVMVTLPVTHTHILIIYAPMLLCSYAPMLLCCYAAMLLCCYAAMLLCCYAAMLLCCYAPMLLCCYYISVFYYYSLTILLSFNRIIICCYAAMKVFAGKLQELGRGCHLTWARRVC
jgi:hypothetical protein